MSSVFSTITASVVQIAASGSLGQMLDNLKTREIDVFSSAYFTTRAFAFGMERDSNSETINVSRETSLRNKFEITRSFDLVTQLYVVIDLPGICNVKDGAYIKPRTDSPKVDEENLTSMCYYTNSCASALVKTVNICMGGHSLAELTSSMMFIFEELGGKPSKRLTTMVGKASGNGDQRQELAIRSAHAQRLYLPMYFWFNSTRGSVANSLNLIGAAFQRCTLDMVLRPLNQIIEQGGAGCRSTVAGAEVRVVEPISDNVTGAVRSGGNVALLDQAPNNDQGAKNSQALTGQTMAARITVDTIGITLNDEDRSAFSVKDRMTLMTECHTMDLSGSQAKIGSFNEDLTKFGKNLAYEIILAARVQDRGDAGLEGATGSCGLNRFEGYFDRTLGVTHEALGTLSLSISGQKRTMDQLESQFYNQVTPYQHHSCLPSCSSIYSLPFSMFPEDWTIPDSTANLSKLDSMKLYVEPAEALKDKKIEYFIHILAYNILVENKGLKARYFV